MTANWLNPAGGDWDTAANWSGNAVPGAADDVLIGTLNAGATVTHSKANVDSVHSLTSQAPSRSPPAPWTSPRR